MNRRTRRAAALAAGAAALATLTTLPGQANAAGTSTRTVTYHGYAVDVPASWRVVDLDANPHACVLLTRSTVFLGRAGDQSSCPVHAAGVAPSLWVAPLDATSAEVAADRDAVVLDHGAAASPGVDGDGQASVVVTDAGVVASTYGGDVAARLLGGARLTGAADRAPAGLTRTARDGSAAAEEPAPGSKVPGKFRGKGFDACAAPSGADMQAWKDDSPYRAVGIYIGGVARSCPQPNLTKSWVQNRIGGGWHLLPIQVGLQSPCVENSSIPQSERMSSDADTARAQGRAAGGGTVENAKRLGIGAGAVLWYDMEGYDSSNDRCRIATLNFLTGYTHRVKKEGYRSGVYSSGSSGIADINATYDAAHYERPNMLWAAIWNGEANSDFKPYVPDGRWNHRQRVHQYQGGHDETHGGVTINVDSDYLSVH